jgi:hypothetical protein
MLLMCVGRLPAAPPQKMERPRYWYWRPELQPSVKFKQIDPLLFAQQLTYKVSGPAR